MLTDLHSPEAIARALVGEIEGLQAPNVPRMRAVREACSRQLRHADGELVLDVARLVYARLDDSWVAFELIRHHDRAMALVTESVLEELGQRLDSWGVVDSFAGYLAGPAWMRGQITNEVVHRWARSDDRWWRRTALVATVVLNTPSHGGSGDVPRTLDVCALLVDDRDDMVVKAMSWALRRLIGHDAEAVRGFLDRHSDRLAARVLREVRNKLETGLKNPRRAP